MQARLPAEGQQSFHKPCLREGSPPLMVTPHRRFRKRPDLFPARPEPPRPHTSFLRVPYSGGQDSTQAPHTVQRAGSVLRPSSVFWMASCGQTCKQSQAADAFFVIPNGSPEESADPRGYGTIGNAAGIPFMNTVARIPGPSSVGKMLDIEYGSGWFLIHGPQLAQVSKTVRAIISS